MINPRAKQLWLDALRSGKYPQGDGNLHVKYTDGAEHFCCLGVLCMVALNEGVHMAIRDKPKYANAVVVQYGDKSGALPSEVMSWSAMDNPNPSFDKKHSVTALFLDRMVDSGFDGSSRYKS